MTTSLGLQFIRLFGTLLKSARRLCIYYKNLKTLGFLEALVLVSFIFAFSSIIRTAHILIEESQKEKSLQSLMKMDDIVTYDEQQKPIHRKDCFIAGKLRTIKTHIFFGIPSIYRQYKDETPFYLQKTIQSLISPLSANQMKLVQFGIFLTDKTQSKIEYMLSRIKESFANELALGLVNVIGIPARYYKNTTRLRSTLGDGMSRMQWRSKQSLDYAFIGNYAYISSEYFVQIEDDVTAFPNYLQFISGDMTDRDFTFREEPWIPMYYQPYATDIPSKSVIYPWNISSNSWLAIRYYHLGYIGVLYRSCNLPMMAFIHRTFYAAFAVDLTRESLVQFNFRLYQRLDLFLHIGNLSSSTGTS